MASSLTLISAIVLLAIGQISASPVQLNLTFAGNHGGLELVKDEVNIPGYQIGKVCHQGVWVAYPNPNFEGSNDRDSFVQIFPSLIKHCVEPPQDPIIRSARFIGNQVDNSLPSVTLFARSHFKGDFKVVLEGTKGSERVDLRWLESLVTINTQVQFFSDENFVGNSYCLPQTSHCRGGVCWQWDLRDLTPTWDIRTAKSIRFGCH